MKKSLFKTLAVSLLLITSTSATAQLQLSYKTLDLEPLGKHKNWQFGEAGLDPATGTVYVKMKQPECDKSETFWTTSYKGLKWNIDKLVFDKDFNYVETKSIKYKSSEEALLNNENIFGKKYKAIAQGSNSPAIATVMASTTTPMPKGPIDNTFMFTTIVTGTATVTGFKLASSFIGVEPSVTTGKGPVYCNEYPVVVKQTSVDAKEEKGQKWIPMFTNPVPNGGNVLFNTVGVNKEEKQHYIFRKYDASTNILKERTFTFDYQCLMFSKEIEIAPGVFDYVFVTLPINYKKSKLPTAPANSYEYFYVDGTTYEIKERLTIQAPNSQWIISQVYAKDGAVYLCGESGKTATTYADFAVPNPKDYPNFQLAKIENGKLVYVKSISPENIKAALVNVNGEKSKADLNFKVHAAQMNAVNGKFIYGGRYQSVKTAVFSENGDLESFIVKNAAFSELYFTFSKDKKTMYCLVQNVLDYNKWDQKTGVITPKAAKQVITSLAVISYNLENKTAKYEDFKNENWGIKFSNQFLFEDDNQLILLGGNITKKAKESEMVFITIKK